MYRGRMTTSVGRRGTMLLEATVTAVLLGAVLVLMARLVAGFGASHEGLESRRWALREARNLMERLAYLSAGDTIELADLSFILAPGADVPTVDANLPLSEATDRFQIEHIRRAIERSRGNMSDAARNLALHRSNLYRKMRQLGMEAEDE